MADFDPAAISAFVAGVCFVVALAASRPAQWGVRRTSFGAALCATSVTASVLSPSAVWWGFALWGCHQLYIGWQFIARRRSIHRERAEYIRSSTSILAYVALADGILDPREAAVIRDTYARGGFSPEDLQEVDLVLAECSTTFRLEGSDPERSFKSIRDACALLVEHSNHQIRRRFFCTAIRLSAADGFVSAAEDRSLRAVATWLGITDQDARDIWREVLDDRTTSSQSDQDNRDKSAESPAAPPDLATYYASILGIEVTATPDEVKRAYRTKAKQYHPDVAAHRGSASAREAEERFKEVAAAYQFFRGNVAPG